MNRTRAGSPALHILFFLSGAAALGYQLVWSKMFSTGLGHEMPAVLAILCAFMAGMALGALILDRFIPRNARAGFWLCGLELTIGVWAILAGLAVPHINELALQFIGLNPSAPRHWAIAFAIPALTLLPATMAIGATLPAMEKFLSIVAPRNESIGSVYAANTFGAVAGTLLTPFVLMPALGLSQACWVLGAANVVAGLGAALLARGADGRARQNTATTHRRTNEDVDSPAHAPFWSWHIAVSLFLTGLLGITYEMVGVRVLSQVLEGTVFTYAAVLAVFLLGTAAGAAAFHRWWRTSEPARLPGRLLAAAAGAGWVGVLALSQSPLIYKSLRGFGDAPGAVLAAELITAFAVFGLPTFFMGAVFSHLLGQARAQYARVGGMLALNTLGAAAAPVLVLLLLPLVGARHMLLFTCLSYVALSLPYFPGRIAGRLGALATIATLTSLGFMSLKVVDVPPGSRVISYREGIMATVAVTEDPQTNRTLRVDNRYQMGGTAAADVEYRQAHLPLLFHPNPRRALFLGVGTGVSLGAASLYPDILVDGVELVPEVVEAMPLFESKNFSAARLPNFRLHQADARRFVRANQEQYDVIIADLFHPYRDGAGALYTQEHFEAVRHRLATNGLFCQWLPLHQLDEPTLRVIVRTFQSVYPRCEGWLLRFNVQVPVVALVGHAGLPRWSSSQVESRLGETRLGVELKRLALADSLRLFGHWFVDADDLRHFAETAPLNTDDNQRVTFMAPQAAYQRHAKPYASLIPFLIASRKAPGAGPDRWHPGHEATAHRLSPYIAARNVYLRGLIHDAEGRRDQAIEAYIESARVSPDFTTGYAQSVTIATVLAQSDPTRAKKILERLIEAQPERPVAREMLERLFSR